MSRRRPSRFPQVRTRGRSNSRWATRRQRGTFRSPWVPRCITKPRLCRHHQGSYGDQEVTIGDLDCGAFQPLLFLFIVWFWSHVCHQGDARGKEHVFREFTDKLAACRYDFLGSAAEKKLPRRSVPMRRGARRSKPLPLSQRVNISVIQSSLRRRVPGSFFFSYRITQKKRIAIQFRWS